MGDFTDDGMSTDPQGYDSKSYALNGKIMLTAMVILFAVVILIVCLHVYGRWFLLRAGRRHHLRHGRRRTRIVFFSSPTSSAPSGGLDASVLKSLPTFVYSSSSIPDDVLECAVCLSEFEENEKGRLLPKCNHRFHIGCIDMWFDSHSTCPLCRAPVNPEIPAPASDSAVEIVVPLGESPETDAGSSSGVCPSCLYENEMGCSSNSSSSAGSSSIGNHRKPFELVNVSIEVPRRNESFKGLEEEVGLGSPAGQGFKSPGSRILSLKRILSRDRKAATSSATTVNCSSATEIDLEKGEEEQRTQSQSR